MAPQPDQGSSATDDARASTEATRPRRRRGFVIVHKEPFAALLPLLQSAGAGSARSARQARAALLELVIEHVDDRTGLVAGADSKIASKLDIARSTWLRHAETLTAAGVIERAEKARNADTPGAWRVTCLEWLGGVGDAPAPVAQRDRQSGDACSTTRQRLSHNETAAVAQRDKRDAVTSDDERLDPRPSRPPQAPAADDATDSDTRRAGRGDGSAANANGNGNGNGHVDDALDGARQLLSLLAPAFSVNGAKRMRAAADAAPTPAVKAIATVIDGGRSPAELNRLIRAELRNPEGVRDPVAYAAKLAPIVAASHAPATADAGEQRRRDAEHLGRTHARIVDGSVDELLDDPRLPTDEALRAIACEAFDDEHRRTHRQPA